MSRKSLLMFVLFVAGSVTVMWYQWVLHSRSTADVPGNHLPYAGPEQRSSAALISNIDTTPSASVMDSPAIEASTAELGKWEAAVSSDDAVLRAAAIAALGTAPRSSALPILHSLLKTGAYPDRQLVIHSLHTLARQQGDADQAIRTALRMEIYDGSDETISSAAQVTLDEIENDLS